MAETTGGARVVALGPRSEAGLMSTTNLAEANRARVLQALADHGALSRAALARLSGVTRASIGGVVSGLLDEQVLQELPVEGASRRVGKPSRPLWFGDLGMFGAVVLEPGVIEIGVVDAHGGVSLHDRGELPTMGTTADFDAAAMRQIRRTLGRDHGRLQAVGMALPGFFDRDGEILASTTIDSLPGSRLPALVSTFADTTVVLEDDARALALGQRWFGQARGIRDFAAIQIGDGIGAGIMLDGRLHRGPLVGSEVGHMTVDARGERCRCGLIGCWETLASLRWLRERSERAALPDAVSMTPARLAELAQNDVSAGAILDQYADHLGIGIVNLFHILSIPHVILHGAVVGAGDGFLERVREHVHARTMPALSARPAIVMDTNGTQSGLLGAAAAAITHRLGVFL
jgi:predicted NBD/HSP70 family sugar kinase